MQQKPTCTPSQFATRHGMTLSTVHKQLERGKFGSSARRSGRRWIIDEPAAREILMRAAPDDPVDSEGIPVESTRSHVDSAPSRSPMVENPLRPNAVQFFECNCALRAKNHWIEIQGRADLADWLTDILQGLHSDLSEADPPDDPDDPEYTPRLHRPSPDIVKQAALDAIERVWPP